MRVFVVLLLTVSVSCATRTPVTDELVRSKMRSTSIPQVPTITQREHHCGPASLAMVLQFHGKKITEEIAAKGFFHDRLKGSFFTEMKARARQEGVLVLEVNDLRSVFLEVSAGNPVIVLQNNGFHFFPRWHFAVVTGMNFEGPDVYLHDGSNKVHAMDMRLFERSFILGGRRSLVILPPGKTSATGTELGHLEAAIILESLGKHQAAAKAYQGILHRWPWNLLAKVGRANALYSAGFKKAAMDFLTASGREHPTSPVLWHNLAILQGANGFRGRAKGSARRAMKVVGEQERKRFSSSLKDYLQ